MFGKNNKKFQVISVKKYKILGYSIVWGMGDYASVVAVRDEQGKLRHFELIGSLYDDDIEIENNIMEIKDAYVEVTKYSDGSYKTKVCKF